MAATLFDVFDKKQDLSTDSILASIESTVPLYRTMKEDIDRLRDWARDRARPASATQTTGLISGRRIEM